MDFIIDLSISKENISFQLGIEAFIAKFQLYKNIVAII